MNPTTVPTKRGDVMIVEVPMDAYDFDIVNTYRKELRYLLKDSYNPIAGKEQHDVIDLKIKTLDRAEVLGCITNGVIDFDCSELVDGYEIPKDENDYMMRFRNYEIHDGHEHFALPQESFLSLLQSQGIDVTKGKFVVLMINKN